ncbi:MAG: fibronectin type III domain-containing protein [Anaerolineae bacterium]
MRNELAASTLIALICLCLLPLASFASSAPLLSNHQPGLTVKPNPGTSTMAAPAANMNDRWDSAFGVPGANGAVRDLAVDSRGYLYAGGDFTTIGGVATDNVAVYNGEAWAVLSQHTDGSVNALAVGPGDVIYAGGTFTHIGNITAYRVAKWNGTTWSALGPGLNGTVRALAVAQDGTLYAGGFFTSTSESVINLYRVAKWDGLTWSALGPGLNNAVDTLAFDSFGDLYVGGRFTWTAAPDNQRVNYIARWDGKYWYPMNGGVNSHVYALAVSGNTIWVGGAFTETVEGRVDYVVRYDDGKWTPLNKGLDGSVASLAVRGGILYAGGYFSHIGGGGPAASHIARWNGTDWSAMGSGTNDVVEALAASPGGDVYAGGYFSQAGGKPSAYIARWRPLYVNIPLAMRSYTAVPPAPPSDLTAVTYNDSEIDLTWSDNSANETAFVIENSTDGVHFSEYGSLGADVTAATDTELQAGTYYCYRVFARNAEGDSNPSNTACATTTSHVAPLAPSNLTAQVISPTLILLTWTNNSSCTGYKIWESDNGGSSWAGPFDVTPAGMLPGAYVPGVNPGTNYVYKVRAVNAYGQSPDSNTSAQVSTPALPPAAPTQVRVNNNTVYPVISLKIDGVEQFPSAPMGLPPNTYYLKPLSATFHTYSAATGFWSGSSRVEMYTYSGSFTLGSGATSQVSLNNPTITQLLTHFRTSGYYVGEYWSGTIIHSAAFRFFNNGSYNFYRDGALVSSGTYALVLYGGNYLATFQASGVNGGTGYLDERTAQFYMRNGPTDWPSIQYTYDGT